ncbi:DNA topoisomerase I [candidate division Kazan bacterium RBG_13_50_9]|uniref:DNA topoisomerase 1 n=1 Tax=candidate division Kazan bacterium RBG_13_50_9 TaxID=1798535 RepID=A0A1F4NRF8_UNCK3|nr:MAG: DNA topoisomerase I [candidate division Kazan bacterium RBG_13_50_9]
MLVAKSRSALVVVESPTKAKTIGRILGTNYTVESSLGHLRDLPKAKLGVDVDNNFVPEYVIPTKSRKVATKLKKLYEQSSELILATDEDREGEAIGWHVAQVLEVPPGSAKRIVFHEITDEALKEAIQNPRRVDINLVNAQQARRVLDRLVGYKLSPLLWKKIFRGLSAGRVQSVAVRLIVERERERQAFKPQEYWKIRATYLTHDQKQFEAELSKIDGRAAVVSAKPAADRVITELRGSKSQVADIEESRKIRRPSPPFTTSTLQQQAGIQLGFSVKKTMTIAQQLYEGVTLGSAGEVGLITYMRTDSTYVTLRAIEETRRVIADKYGDKFAPSAPRFYKTKSKGAQEAHEAIRPTSSQRTPAGVKAFLSADQLKLYQLIWERAVASQMADAVIDQVDVEITSSNKTLMAQGVSVAFPGFLSALSKNLVAEQTLPPLAVGQELKIKSIDSQQKFTEPLPRYTEPTLVKALEKLGVGRPSTYAPTITTIMARGYVKREKKQLVPQEVGMTVNDFLVEHFPDIVDAKFTAQMEDDLDRIALGRMQWEKVVGEFYGPFAAKLADKEAHVKKQDLDEKTDEICDKCGAPMVIRMGRFGKFLACSRFPECKHTKSLNHPSKPLMPCPKCQRGEVVTKRTKRGKLFYGCNNYPKCDFATWDEPVPQRCPTCGGVMVISKRKKVPTCKECGFEDKAIKE